jgi:hypothetical protein
MKDNKVNGVIIGLTAKKGQVDAFASFLSNDKPTLLPPNSIPQIEKQYKKVEEELKIAKKVYSEVLEQSKTVFEILGQFETLISQYRCQLNIIPKFGVLKQKRKDGHKTYLTARALFFDPALKRSELKLYLGELKDYGTNIKEIQKRPEVIAEARWKLFEYMNQRMGNSLNQTISKYNKANQLKDFKFFQEVK